MKIRESVLHQTVSATYEQEIDRDRAMPSCQRLKTMVRRRIDQMNWTRNFRAQNERIEAGVLVKSHKGKNVSMGRRMGECYQWKAIGQCSKGVLAVLVTEMIVEWQHNHPLLLRRRRFRLTEDSLPRAKSESGCKVGDKCPFRHAEVDRRPSKTSKKKSGGKGSVALLKASFQFACPKMQSHQSSLFHGRAEIWTK